MRIQKKNVGTFNIQFKFTKNNNSKNKMIIDIELYLKKHKKAKMK